MTYRQLLVAVSCKSNFMFQRWFSSLAFFAMFAYVTMAFLVWICSWTFKALLLLNLFPSSYRRSKVFLQHEFSRSRAEEILVRYFWSLTVNFILTQGYCSHSELTTLSIDRQTGLFGLSLLLRPAVTVSLTKRYVFHAQMQLFPNQKWFRLDI